MQDDRKFSGHGDLGLQEADPFDQPEPPGLEPTPVGYAGGQAKIANGKPGLG